jgi:hypothetical protein
MVLIDIPGLISTPVEVGYKSSKTGRTIFGSPLNYSKFRELTTVAVGPPASGVNS